MKRIIAALCLSTLLGFSNQVSATETTTLSMLRNTFFDKEAEASSLTVEEIVDETREVKEEIKNLSENYVIENIREYNAIVADIKKEVSSRKWFLFKKDDKDKYTIIFEGIEEIRDFYSELQQEGRKEEVRADLLSHVTSIQQFTKAIPIKIEAEQRTRQALAQELDNLASLAAEKQEIRQKAVTQRLSLCDRRISMLEGFHQNYQQMQVIMANAEAAIDRFMFTIAESSKVYDDAYRTLKLGHDISTAYQTLEEFKSLDTISQNIMQSWKDLDDIVASLTSQVSEFNTGV